MQACARAHTHSLCATMMVIPSTQRFTHDNKYVLPTRAH